MTVRKSVEKLGKARFARLTALPELFNFSIYRGRSQHPRIARLIAEFLGN